MIRIIFIFTLAHLSLSLNLKPPQNHQYSIQTSQRISKGIKEELLQNLYKISNKTAAEQLKNDLNEPDNDKRTMTEIDSKSAAEIFQIFDIKYPGCDKSEDGFLRGFQLKCLNKIWKQYVPNDT